MKHKGRAENGRLPAQISALFKGGKGDSLLALEKKRRGIPTDKLAFLSISNVAHYAWCAAQSVLVSRRDELKFFESYLHDRLSYSASLGQIDKLPKTKDEILEVGDAITLDDIENLLRERAGDAEPFGGGILTMDVINEKGEKVVLVKPDTTGIEKKVLKDILPKTAKIGNLDDFPLERGVFLHESRAEGYPTIRWNFGWKDYRVVGVPDGITNDFVYEFKTTRNNFTLINLRYVALAQADLYGHFFRRKKKRVQLFVTETNTTDTTETETNHESAEDYLRRFMDADHGGLLKPPKEFKCPKCQVREMCPHGRSLSKPQPKPDPFCFDRT